MLTGKMVFAQVMDWIHPEQFRRCVARYHGHYKVRNFSCWDQFLAMAFAQITYPPDKQEKATATVLKQAELLCADWAG